MSIDVVFCDVGGVLLDMSGVPRRAVWSERLGITEESLSEAVWDAIGFRDKHAFEEVIDRIVERLEVARSEVPQFLDDFSAHWKRNDELFTFVSSLRGSCRLAVIGNIPSSGRFVFETVLHLDDVFEAMFLSGELGIEKPDPRIYEIACTEMGVAPERSVFIDDLSANVEGARAVGIVAHQHHSNRDTIAWLRAHLKLPPASPR